jgi:hypothetical protein
MLFEEIVHALSGLKQAGNGQTAKCPAHDDRHNSLSVKRAEDGKTILHCHAGCSVNQICSALGIEIRDLFDNQQIASRKEEWRVLESYQYKDENGAILYENCRLAPLAGEAKPFRARRYENGRMVWNLNGVRRVPYRLVEMLLAVSLEVQYGFLCEGEKDADAMRELGLLASSLKHWRPEFNQYLTTLHVTLVRDHDLSGVKQAEDAARTIGSSALSVRILDVFAEEPLPDSHGRDISDWIAAQKQNGMENDQIAERLSHLADAAPLYSPAPEIRTTPGHQSSRFTICTLDALLNEPPANHSYVWDDTLIRGGFSITSAKPKVGKSTMARNLAACVIKGEPFLGRNTQKGRVLYLCLEEKRSEVAKHFERMSVSGTDILIHTGGAPENGLEALYAAIVEVNPTMVIIDPLSRVLRVADLNSYSQVAMGLEGFIDLARNTGVHIIALHHDGKGDRSGGDALLGSTALYGAVDCHIQMRQKDKRRTIASVQRYGTDLMETVIDLDSDTGVIIEKGDLLTITITEMRREIISQMADDEHLTEGEIKERVTGGSKGIVSKAIRRCVEAGELYRTGNGKRNAPFLYSKKPFDNLGLLG